MYVKVTAKTGMKREALVRISETHFEISVREKPLQNLANKRIIALIAAHFSVPAGKVRIIHGHHSPSKLLSVDE